MPLLVMLEVLQEVEEKEADDEEEIEPVGEVLAQDEYELLIVAHGEGERVLHSLTVRLVIILALAAPEVEPERVLEVDRLADTVPQVL